MVLCILICSFLFIVSKDVHWMWRIRLYRKRINASGYYWSSVMDRLKRRTLFVLLMVLPGLKIQGLSASGHIGQTQTDISGSTRGELFPLGSVGLDHAWLQLHPWSILERFPCFQEELVSWRYISQVRFSLRKEHVFVLVFSASTLGWLSAAFAPR